jgi:hypothetical protein
MLVDDVENPLPVHLIIGMHRKVAEEDVTVHGRGS